MPAIRRTRTSTTRRPRGINVRAAPRKSYHQLCIVNLMIHPLQSGNVENETWRVHGATKQTKERAGFNEAKTCK